MSVPNSPFIGKAQSCKLLGTEPHTDQAALGQRDNPMQGWDTLLGKHSLCSESSAAPTNHYLLKCRKKKTKKFHPVPYCKSPPSFTSNWPFLPLCNMRKHWIEPLINLMDLDLPDGSVTTSWVHSRVLLVKTQTRSTKGYFLRKPQLPTAQAVHHREEKGARDLSPITRWGDSTILTCCEAGKRRSLPITLSSPLGISS